MIHLVHNTWWPWLQEEWKQPYFQKLSIFLHEEYQTRTIYPPHDQVFAAFENCDYPDVKVVILGQDPYHEPHQAHGMCFSVNPGIPIPPSLQNIYKELQTDLGCTIPNNGYLMPWAKQGVFLLNTTMTVRQGQANSHAGKGWDVFTDHVIQKINEKQDPVVFLLWGRNARNKAALIDRGRHLVLEAAHPSPLSAYNGFFGCAHFSKANAFLKEKGKTPIDWQIPDL
ncbi:MAG: uracil-DNA glycosylase [Solobacterium sp.]|jgi:uracil-DNA glycosylase|nr:uracil-DNA glycosylase [Solobacterium sp.]MCH4205787.1 uracil-DNA glycosylase [Solobacterium sp.]MCH4227311.1 uracil-DNA glycosylase [Solobacterium sp.]